MESGCSIIRVHVHHEYQAKGEKSRQSSSKLSFLFFMKYNNGH
jgi:hypothetical protein